MRRLSLSLALRVVAATAVAAPVATVAASGAAAAGTVPPVAPAAETWQFPGAYPFVVPDGVYQLEVTAAGARGGNATAPGGPGGAGDTYSAVVAVTPGEAMDVVVGAHPGDYYSPPGGGPGGTTDGEGNPLPGGGGNGGNGNGNGNGGAGGGGLSGLFDAATGLAPVLVAAGGGGGGGPDHNCGCGAAGAGGEGGPAGWSTVAGLAASSTDGAPVAPGGTPEGSSSMVGSVGAPGTLSGDGGSGGGGGGYSGGGGGGAVTPSYPGVNQPGAGGAGGTSWVDPTRIRAGSATDLGTNPASDGTVSLTPLVPDPTANLTVAPSTDETSATVSWDPSAPLQTPDPATNGSFLVEIGGYQVTVASPDGGAGTGVFPATGSGLTLSGLTPGAAYALTVRPAYYVLDLSGGSNGVITAETGPYFGPAATVDSQRSTVTAIGESSNPIRAGRALTLTATVTGADGFPLDSGADPVPAGSQATDNGTLTFTADGKVITGDDGLCTAPVTLIDGTFTASCTVSSLPAGIRAVSALYSGAPSFAASSAPVASVLVALPPFEWLDAAPPVTVAAGQAYTYTFEADGTPAPTYYAYALPNWLTLNPATGTVSGTAPEVNSSTADIEVGATNAGGDLPSSPFRITVTGAPASSLTLAPVTLPPATSGSVYDAAPPASGGTPGYSWALATGSSLPPGLSLDATGGNVAGEPSASGTYHFRETVTDSAVPPNRRTATVTLTVDPVTVTSTTLPPAEVGRTYSALLTATGGTAPFTWTLTRGCLPAGLQLHPTGTITGTPTAAGRCGTFTVQATDSSGHPTIAAGSVTLAVAATPKIVTSALPPGTTGVAYTAALGTSGGVGRMTWAVAAGSLPAGLTLSAAGVLSGTPTMGGKAAFTVTVGDALGGTATRTLKLSVG